MESNMISLKLDQDMVRPVIEKQIQSAVLAGIGNPEELIGAAISLALKQKVNSDGRVDNYGSYNTYDFLEVLTKKTVQATAEEALREWLSDNAKLVREVVIKELNKPERRESIVGAFADAVENSMKCGWSFSCNVNFQRDND